MTKTKCYPNLFNVMEKKYLILVILFLIMAASSIASVIIVCPDWLSLGADCKSSHSVCAGWEEVFVGFALVFSVVMVACVGAKTHRKGEYELYIKR